MLQQRRGNRTFLIRSKNYIKTNNKCNLTVAQGVVKLRLRYTPKLTNLIRINSILRWRQSGKIRRRSLHYTTAGAPASAPVSPLESVAYDAPEGVSSPEDGSGSVPFWRLSVYNLTYRLFYVIAQHYICRRSDCGILVPGQAGELVYIIYNQYQGSDD